MSASGLRPAKRANRPRRLPPVPTAPAARTRTARRQEERNPTKRANRSIKSASRRARNDGPEYQLRSPGRLRGQRDIARGNGRGAVLATPTPRIRRVRMRGQRLGRSRGSNDDPPATGRITNGPRGAGMKITLTPLDPPRDGGRNPAASPIRRSCEPRSRRSRTRSNPTS